MKRCATVAPHGPWLQVTASDMLPAEHRRVVGVPAERVDELAAALALVLVLVDVGAVEDDAEVAEAAWPERQAADRSMPFGLQLAEVLEVGVSM